MRRMSHHDLRSAAPPGFGLQSVRAACRLAVKWLDRRLIAWVAISCTLNDRDLNAAHLLAPRASSESGKPPGRSLAGSDAAGVASRLRAILRALVVTAALTLAPHADATDITKEAETFRQAFVDALARDDRQAVAGMVRYRMIVDAGLLIPVTDRRTLFKLWDVIFSPATRCLIEQSRFPRPGVPPPRYELHVDSRGASFGSGRIRADRGADGLKIVRITLAAGYGLSSPRTPRQVVFRWGTGRLTYAGRLLGDDVDVYVIEARRGHLLNAQLQRVSPDRVTLRIVHGATGRVLPTAGPKGADLRRLWAGPVPESGAYRVEVARRGAFCDPPTSYQLVLSLE